MDLAQDKICTVGVLVDEIEKEYSWSTENRKNLLDSKKNTGKTQEFLKMWTETLGDLPSERNITLKELINEMINERSRHEKRMNVAEIFRKPDTATTAEDTNILAARVLAEELPSASSYRSNPTQGAKVEDDVREAVPKAAPAVILKIAKAPPEPPPRRPTYSAY